MASSILLPQSTRKNSSILQLELTVLLWRAVNPGSVSQIFAQTRLQTWEVAVNRIAICLLVGFLAVALAGASAWAQGTTAQISGIVKDTSGAVLPGVEITVTQTATAVKRSVVTNETGNYVLASLPLGPYMLEASLPGFKSYVQ